MPGFFDAAFVEVITTVPSSLKICHPGMRMEMPFKDEPLFNAVRT